MSVDWRTYTKGTCKTKNKNKNKVTKKQHTFALGPQITWYIVCRKRFNALLFLNTKQYQLLLFPSLTRTYTHTHTPKHTHSLMPILVQLCSVICDVGVHCTYVYIAVELKNYKNTTSVPNVMFGESLLSIAWHS